MIVFFNLLYLALVLFFLLSALFICYHIVRYSLSHAESTITLFVFLSVFLVLFFTNLFLYSAVNLDRLTNTL